MTEAVTFCATGRTGLGHLRRVTNIARALDESSPGLGFRLLTNAALGGLTAEEADLYQDVVILERCHMVDRMRAESGGPVVVDTAVLPGLNELDRPLCLILRQTVADKVGHFALDRGRPWDLVILPNPEGHWRPDSSVLPARSVAAVGWIYRHSELSDPRNVERRERRSASARVLIATGGGGTEDGAAMLGRDLAALLHALREAVRDPFEIVQCLGPSAPATARVDGVDRVVQPGGRLNDWFGQADLIVSTVGYNSVLEIATTDVPTLLIPISRTFDDQSARAETWARCLGYAHHWGDIERSAAWMASMLIQGRRRPTVDLGVSGAGRAARLVLDLMP
jgi:predicted glycosyltransferase